MTARSLTASAPAWSLAGLVATHPRGRLDLALPAAGIEVPTANDSDHLLALDLRSPRGDGRLVDHWLRGDDLVAVYEPADPRRLKATAMWRSLSAGPAAWELVISAQTALVESDSTLAVTSDVGTGEISWGRTNNGRIAWSPLAANATCPPEASCLLIRRAADTVLVAVHPADPRRITTRRIDTRLHVACWLFTAAIEKGVLLRSRVLAATGPAGDAAWADALALALATAPPPLST